MEYGVKMAGGAGALAVAVVVGLAASGHAAGLGAGGPVDVQSQQLEVRQTQGLATFSGNVKVTQGNLVLEADRVDVEYGSSGDGDIRQMKATGNVVLTRGGGTVAEKATGDVAVYTPAGGQIVMTGAVTLVRGASTLSGDKLTYGVESGNARVTSSKGPVRARFVPQKGQ